MKRLFFLVLLGLASCSGHYQMMGREQFAEIDIGTPQEVVERQYGPPYAIHSHKHDSEILEYIERLDIGTQTVQVKRYFLVVRDGKVIGKYVKVTNPPGYQKIYSDDAFENFY